MGNLKVVPGERAEGWGKLIGDYLAHSRAKGLSLVTLDQYTDVLNRVLLDWVKREGITPKRLGRRDLDRLAAELLNSGRSRRTAHTYGNVINRFLKWCAEEQETAALRTPQPRVERPVIPVLERSEINRMEDAADSERDKLILRVLADTGMRVGELRRLRVDDLVVQGRDRYLHVRGKGAGGEGAKERLVPLLPGLYQRLDRYIRRGRPECGTDLLFVTLNRGRSGDYQPVSESTVQHLVEILGRKVGLKQRVHPHLFRHSAATHLLRKGVSPIQVRDILGHSSLRMIDEVYSHLAPSDASAAMIAAMRDE